MLESLKHRGPDGEGSFVEKGLGLGMRRLAILDVQHGHQPYVSEDGQVIAVYNGELYNYPVLRDEVLSLGHRLNSGADGEVLVHLYEEYGTKVLSRLSGMFAIAIWDRRRHELLLARDRIGQKPLYILETDQIFAFSSEIKAFMGLDGYAPSVDERVIPAYLAHRFAPAPETLLKNMTKLRPGEAMRVKKDGRKERWLYWEPVIEEPDSHGRLLDWIDRLDALMTEVVTSHMASDVPLGVFLSGGLDSSVLTALAARSHRGTMDAWSAAFPEEYPGYDEFSWAKKVADLYQVPIHRVNVDPTITPERVRELAYVLDEPMADPTVLPLDGVAQAAREANTVMLSGEGADEIFSGYAGYGEVQSLRWLRRVPPGVRSWWIRQGYKGAGAFQRATEPIRERYRGVGFTFGSDALAQLLVPELRGADRTAAMQQYWDDYGHLSELQAMQGFDIRWFLPDDVLLKADRIGMHHNLEIRVPYCDHEVVELALKIPLALRRIGRRDKRVLRGMARRYLPAPIVERPKRGFPTPLTSLLAGPLYEMAFDTLTDPVVMARGWFQPGAVADLLGQLANRSPVAARKVYTLLMLELWNQELVEKGRDRLRGQIRQHSLALHSPMGQ